MTLVRSRTRARLRRVLIAAGGAAVVSWPIVDFQATVEQGARFGYRSALTIGLVVLGLGLVYTMLLDISGRFPRHRIEAVVAGVRARPHVETGAILVLLLFLATLPFYATRAWEAILVETLVFATIAIGLNISMGMAGLLVLGHAAFWGIGAYTFTLLVVRLQWNFWFAFPAAGLAAAFAGLVVGLPALRLRGDYLAIVTLGFGEAIRWVFKNEEWLTGGDAGIPGNVVPGDIRARHGWLGTWLWQPRTTTDCYLFALGLLVVCVICVTLFTRSRFGRALLALREDEMAARCMGIDTVRVKLLAFTASAFWAGLAGVVHPIFRGQITPQLFDFNASVLFVSMVVLGGLGSIAGSILGAALLFMLPPLLRDKFPAIQDYRLLVFGAVLTALMVVRPEGLLGARRKTAGASS